MWLNVSAILYNSELSKITESQNLMEDPIHFEEFQEIEETDFRSNKMYMYGLLLDKYAVNLQVGDEENERNAIEPEDSHA